MSRWSFAHLADQDLFPALVAGVADERGALARVLALLAEFDARRLYLPAAHPTMYEYCVQVLHMSEDRACKRIRAARLARRFPRVLVLVAEGRIGLGALLLLAPRLTPENADGLLEAACHRTRAEVEQLLAEHFPRPEVPASLDPLAAWGSQSEVAIGAPFALECGAVSADGTAQVVESPSAPGRMNEHIAAPADEFAPRARIAPLAPGRWELRGTLSSGMRDRLLRARDLLSHAVPSGDVVEVLDRALEVLLERLARRRHAAARRPRPLSRPARGRSIPAAMRREVWERDGGRCTFTSAGGHRCGETRFLQYDHVRPVACGGESTPANLRLLCRAHNQYEAERVLGGELMAARREQARRERAQGADGHAAAGTAGAPSAGHGVEKGEERVNAPPDPATCAVAAGEPASTALRDDLHAALRGLGFRGDEARRGAALADNMPGASLEQCLRSALVQLTRPIVQRGERLARCSA